MICLFFRFGQILKFLHLLIARSPKNPMETLATPDGRRQFQGDTLILWNASFMPSDMQRKAIEDVVNVFPKDDSEARHEMFSMVNMLLERKQRYFSQNKRLIMDYHITESAHSIYLDVMSTVPEGYHPER